MISAGLGSSMYVYCTCLNLCLVQSDFLTRAPKETRD